MRNVKQSVVALLLLFALRPMVVDATWDHLEPPVNLPDRAAYEKLLAEKLYLTPFDCGRVLIEPPFKYGESSLSIYSQNKKYLVNYVEAADSLNDWSDGGRDVGRAESVKVQRFEAEISQSAATLLKQIWIKMLSDVRAMPTREAPEHVWGDATIATFSIQVDADSKLLGETLMVPDTGKKVTQLIHLTDSLEKYCKAKEKAREPILKKIELQAKQLLGDFDGK